MEINMQSRGGERENGDFLKRSPEQKLNGVEETGFRSKK